MAGLVRSVLFDPRGYADMIDRPWVYADVCATAGPSCLPAAHACHSLSKELEPILCAQTRSTRARERDNIARTPTPQTGAVAVDGKK